MYESRGKYIHIYTCGKLIENSDSLLDMNKDNNTNNNSNNSNINMKWNNIIIKTSSRECK